jgi:disulfide oxidoreductase YuzD
VKPLTLIVYPAGVVCARCLRGPYRSRIAAWPHAIMCRRRSRREILRDLTRRSQDWTKGGYR